MNWLYLILAPVLGLAPGVPVGLLAAKVEGEVYKRRLRRRRKGVAL